MGKICIVQRMHDFRNCARELIICFTGANCQTSKNCVMSKEDQVIRTALLNENLRNLK